MRRLLDLTSSPAVPGAVTCTSAAQMSTSLLVPTEVRQAGWGWVRLWWKSFFEDRLLEEEQNALGIVSKGYLLLPFPVGRKQEWFSLTVVLCSVGVLEVGSGKWGPLKTRLPWRRHTQSCAPWAASNLPLSASFPGTGSGGGFCSRWIPACHLSPVSEVMVSPELQFSEEPNESYWFSVCSAIFLLWGQEWQFKLETWCLFISQVFSSMTNDTATSLFMSFEAHVPAFLLPQEWNPGHRTPWFLDYKCQTP